jgi:hypothetical protein
MGENQCGLCLSCAAPFAFHSQDVSFYDRPGNLSILYLNEKCRHHPALMERFIDPKFVDVKEKSHIFHESHHGAAIHYMTHHHSGDGPPNVSGGAGGKQRIATQNGPMPYFTGARASTGPKVATWIRPAEGQRVDLTPLLKFLVEHRDDHRRLMVQNLDLTFFICKGCNALMTNAAMVGFLVGLGVNAKKNAQVPLIHVGDTPIAVRTADPDNVIDLTKAFNRWFYTPSDIPTLLPDQTSDDPIAPGVGYYLHCCLPFMAPGVVGSPFAPGGSLDVVKAVRLQYVELSWLILMITCTLTLIEQGKPYGDRPTGGMQQHYGVLDVYVSYFVWRLMKYEFGDSNSRSPDFVQWHQKYFWDAMRMPVFNGRRSQSGLGAEILPNSQVAAQELFALVCTELMDLYEVKLRPLVMFVAKQAFPAARSPDQDFTLRYFVPPNALRALIRMRNTVRSCVCIGFIPARLTRRAVAGQARRLRRGPVQLRDQRAPLPDDPAQLRRDAAAAQGLPALVAVPGDRPHPRQDPRAHHALRPHPLHAVQPAGPARRASAREGRRGRGPGGTRVLPVDGRDRPAVPRRVPGHQVAARL